MFTSAQLKQLSDRGISLDQASRQLEIFNMGIDPVKLLRPAIPNDGIEVYEQQKVDYYVSLFQREKNHYSLIKFVPASGAASRMFKILFEAISEFINNPKDFTSIFQKMPEIAVFFKDLKNYPFYDDLDISCKFYGSNLLSMLESNKFAELLNLLLSVKGLSYGELPKGLLKFHKYSDEVRTAFEEHFVEATFYLRDKKDKVKIHFTVSPEHLKLFEDLTEKLVKKYLEKEHVQFEIGFSVQKPSTDTLAVDMENKPLIGESGMLLFRPGGHGALLDNMQDINEQIVFIGNIDNISPDRTKALRVRYKELLAGILIERVQRIHSFLISIKSGYSEKIKEDILGFIKNYVSEYAAYELSNLSGDDFIKQVINIINRPVRVCGMVKNVGEPGGGPFWISDKSGKVSKQIVESSQVNLKDSQQDGIFKEATHFNPVDMVCFTSSYLNEKFKLEDFRDPEMAFIAVKSQGGNSLKALELPGLWNGSMAGWLTFFVDIPVETFTPVKTIFDLRREEHTA